MDVLIPWVAWSLFMAFVAMTCSVIFGESYCINELISQGVFGLGKVSRWTESKTGMAMIDRLKARRYRTNGAKSNEFLHTQMTQNTPQARWPSICDMR